MCVCVYVCILGSLAASSFPFVVGHGIEQSLGEGNVVLCVYCLLSAVAFRSTGFWFNWAEGGGSNASPMVGWKFVG